MWTEEQFIELEQEERTLTDEAIAVMILLTHTIRYNLEKELRSFYQKYGKDDVVTYADARKRISDKNHTKRLTALLLFINNEFQFTLPYLADEFENMLKSVIQKESDFFDVEVEDAKLLDKKWGDDVSTWLDRLDEDVDLWTTKIASDLKRSILQRKTLDEVLTKLNKRFDSIESAITTLGLSESTAIGSFARQKIFKELGINKYQFYTKADERTCETCGAMHGLVFPMSAYEVGVTASPVHPRCRCWEVPIME